MEELSDQQRDNETKHPKRKSQKGINPFVLMFIVIIIAAIATYFLPAGQYDREEKAGQTVIDSETFEFVESSPVNVIEIFSNIHVGMTDAASIILFVFMFGGALGIMQATGAIDSFIKVASIRFQKRELLLITTMTLIFSLLGALIGSAEDSLVYIAIIVPMTIALGFDAITGFAIVMLGTMATGFTSGITNPFNVGVAQEIAEVPIFSGMGMRIAFFAVMVIITIFYIYFYAMKVKKNPLLGEYGKFEEETEAIIDKHFKMSKQHLVSLLVLAFTFIAVVFGVIRWDWFISEIGGLFVFGGIIMAIICKLTPNKIADSFVSGVRDMASGAMIIGVAYTILVILEDGNLLDTILYYASNVVGELPVALNAIGMFITQLFINFIVPSGSGQAALMMPIMTPLADLVDVNRQVAVLAFQLGDGISNMVFPTSGVLLAGLAIAGIPFTKWVKWVFPYFLIQVGVGIIFVIIAQAIQYGS